MNEALEALDNTKESVYFYIDAIKGYYTQAHSISRYIISSLILLELSFMGIKIALGEMTSLSNIIKKICYIGAWLYIGSNIDVLAVAFVKTLTKMSALLGENTASVDFLGNPLSIIEFGYEVILKYIINDLIESAKTFSFWKDGAVLNFAILFILLLGVGVSLGIIAVIVLMVQIEFYLIILIAILLLPFMLNEKTKFVAEKIIPAITGQGTKLMIIGIVTQLTLNGYKKIFDAYIYSDSLSLMDTLYIMIIITVGLYLIIQSQTFAQVLLSGMPDTNFMRQAAAMTGSAMAAFKIVSKGKELGKQAQDKRDEIQNSVSSHLKGGNSSQAQGNKSDAGKLQNNGGNSSASSSKNVDG